MKANILNESGLSDNERKNVYFVRFKDSNGNNKIIVIHARNIDEMTLHFRKFEGSKAQIVNIEKATESEYREELL